jgi:hypothetical protein
MELLYFCSGIAIAVAAFIALSQIRISRESIAASTEIARTSARRDAFRLAAEQCAYYYLQIVPMFNGYDKWVKESGLRDAIEAVRFTTTADGIKLVPQSDAALGVYFEKVLPRGDEAKILLLLNSLNALEGFSIMFSAGVASEEVAFSSIGHTFCKSVSGIMPSMLLLGGQTHFQHQSRYSIYGRNESSASGYLRLARRSMKRSAALKVFA